LKRHILNSGCGDDDADTCLPLLDDVVIDEEESVPPPDCDSDQDVVDPPPPLEPFPGWDSFDPAMTPSIRDHFITGAGKLLSEQSRTYFANEHSVPGNGVANLVANAFNYKGESIALPDGDIFSSVCYCIPHDIDSQANRCIFKHHWYYGQQWN
jgi:hypothetical protein